MKLNYENLVAVVCIIAILVAVSGCISTSNNTTTNITEKNVTNSNNTTTAYISADKAKELAAQYTGMGVNRGTLGTPTLTTFNGIKVWKFPVNNGYYTIYIDAVTGKRVQ